MTQPCHGDFQRRFPVDLPWPDGIFNSDAWAYEGLRERAASRPPRGGVPKWSNGADCKSVGIAFEGSNPSPTTSRFEPATSGISANNNWTFPAIALFPAPRHAT